MDPTDSELLIKDPKGGSTSCKFYFPWAHPHISLGDMEGDFLVLVVFVDDVVVLQVCCGPGGFWRELADVMNEGRGWS